MPEPIEPIEPIEPTPTSDPPATPQPPAQQTLTPDEAQRLQENVSQFRQYEKQYKAQIVEMKKQIKAFETDQATRQTAETEAERTRLTDQEKWKELAEAGQAENVAQAQRLADMEAQLVDSARRSAGHRAATAAGAVNPDDLNFMNAIIDIDMSDKDAEALICAAVEAMKETHVYLFKPAEPETPVRPGLTSFNPSGDGPRLTDAQRIARLNKRTGQGSHGMFGSQTEK